MSTIYLIVIFAKQNILSICQKDKHAMLMAAVRFLTNNVPNSKMSTDIKRTHCYKIIFPVMWWLP